MTGPVRNNLTPRRERLVLEREPELLQATDHYLTWSGQPLTPQSRERTSSRIRGLCAGKSVVREELHVQLVVDELLEGLRRAS